jgi:hypothetical protein
MEHYIGFLLCTIGYRYSWYLHSLQIRTNPSKSIGYAQVRIGYFYSTNIHFYDDISFLLQITGCDSGTTRIPESGAVARAVAKLGAIYPKTDSCSILRHWYNDNSGFLLQIADCDSGTTSIPESGAVAGAA